VKANACIYVVKNEAIMCNIGHFVSEIELACLKNCEDIKRIEIKPQADKFVYPNGKAIFVLVGGRLVNSMSNKQLNSERRLSRITPMPH
jgi:S-adenosylhomocysteine hydrolase